MKWMDIVGKRVGHYIPIRLEASSTGAMISCNNANGCPKKFSIPAFVEYAASLKVEYKPHPFNPNDYIGTVVGIYTIMGNDTDDHLYHFTGPDIDINPSIMKYYTDYITFDVIEPWVKLPSRKMIWTKCNKCGNVAKLSVRKVFENRFNTNFCDQCDAFSTFTSDLDKIRDHRSPGNIELLRAKDSIVTYRCKKCGEIKTMEKDKFPAAYARDLCPECYRVSLIEKANDEYDKFCSMMFDPKIKHGKLTAIAINNYNDDPTVFNRGQVDITFRCECGNEFTMSGSEASLYVLNCTAPKPMEYFQYIESCPECEKKKINEIDDEIGTKKGKLTFIKKLYNEEYRDERGAIRYRPVIACECKCGNKVMLPYYPFMMGRFRSCGQCKKANAPKLYEEENKEENENKEE